jgi:CDP-glycerol glycerophosphotransferase (TagB/SpsB family)
MSTWGPECLLKRLQKPFLEQLVSLQKQYRFILTYHLHNRRHPPTANRIEWLRNQGIEVFEPEADWVPLLRAADLAIADHTSLSLSFATTRKPMLLLSLCQETPLKPQGPVAGLTALYPTLDQEGDLSLQIEGCFATFDPGPIARWVKNTYPCLGEARNRIRPELNALLK